MRDWSAINVLCSLLLLQVCQGELSKYDTLLQHKLLHFNTTHVCYACDTYFVTLESLLLHINSVHRDILGSYPKGDAFICLVCVQRFAYVQRFCKQGILLKSMIKIL